jgi:hypothetical protein
MAPLTKMCITNLSVLCQRWHWDACLGHVKPEIFSLCAAVRQTGFLPSLSLNPVSKTASLHTQTTRGPKRKRYLNGIMAIMSKIWAQSALELDLSLRCLVLDAVLDARARTGVRRARPERLSEPRPRPCSPAPIKPPRACLTSPRAHHRRPDTPS